METDIEKTESLIDDSLIIVDDDADVELIDKDKKIEIEEAKSNKKQQKTIQEFDINCTEKLTTGDELILPSDFIGNTQDVLQKTPNIKIADNPESRKWADAVSSGLDYNTFNETFVPTLEDETAEFTQKPVHGGVNLIAQAPKHKAAVDQNLKGERALLRLITHLGMGSMFQVPLWHSGMWITFKPPTESELIELNRLLISDKIKFGRYAYGLAFSNVTAFTIDRLVDFALSHIYDVTVKTDEMPIDNIKDHISSQDIPSLLWGFICTMYPRGFKYSRPCINNPEKCNFILEETLNVTKLQWTNTLALTDWQKTHMASRQPKIKDLASVKRYKEELSKIQDKRISINEDTERNIFMTIRTPSITEYIDAGHKWINNIVNVVHKALAANANEDERNNIIVQYGQATAMRQYIHWVSSIEYDTNIINDIETLEQVLDTLSADDSIRDKFISTVIDYINMSTISVIGIPVFNCPKCNSSQEENNKLPHHANVIPLDMVQLFFGLLTQRISRIMER